MAGRVEALYRRDHERLWRSLFAFTGDRDLASEAASEAFAQLLRRGDAVADPAAWVWRSAFKIATGLLAARSTQRRNHTAIDEHTSSTESVPASLAEFMAVLGHLSEQQRACVVLRYVADLDAAGIAQALGTSPGTVRVQLHRAHDVLRHELAEGPPTATEGAP